MDLSSRKSVRNTTFCLLNIRSVKNKTTALTDFILENNFDIIALTETWLSDADAVTLGDLTPAGYSLHQVSRKKGRGGGVAILYRSGLIVTRSNLAVAETFESLSVCVSSGACSTRIVVLYRPPSTSTTNFLVELASLLDTLVLYPTSLLLAGDFNFHVNSSTSIDSAALRDLLISYDLEQHVQTPTHKAGHILDLVITRSSEEIISDVTVYDPQFCQVIAVSRHSYIS